MWLLHWRHREKMTTKTSTTTKWITQHFVLVVPSCLCGCRTKRNIPPLSETPSPVEAAGQWGEQLCSSLLPSGGRQTSLQRSAATGTKERGMNNRVDHREQSWRSRVVSSSSSSSADHTSAWFTETSSVVLSSWSALIVMCLLPIIKLNHETGTTTNPLIINPNSAVLGSFLASFSVLFRQQLVRTVEHLEQSVETKLELKENEY